MFSEYIFPGVLWRTSIQNIKSNVNELKTITDDGYQFGDALKAIYNLMSVAINVILVPFDFIFFVFDTFNWYISYFVVLCNM